MRSLLWLTVLVSGGIAAACLLVGASAGPECGSGMASVACLGGSIGAWSQGFGLAAAIAIALVVALAGSTLAQVRHHHRLARSLAEAAQTTWLADHEVGLVVGLSAPCVAGLTHSRIYCPPDLAERLSQDELRAVILHERHHQLAYAPARLILLAALRPALRTIPGGRGWLERRQGAIEIAADDHALTSGAGRSALARALIKLETTNPGVGLAGYASASEVRLRHLLGEVSSGGQAQGSVALLAIPIAALMACLLLGRLT